MAFTDPGTVGTEKFTTSMWETYIRDNFRQMPRNLSTITTVQGNTGGGEKDLMSFTVPAGTLAKDGDRLVITAWGLLANNGNTKTVKGYVGGTQVTAMLTTTAAAVSWRAVIELVRTSATTSTFVSAIMVNGGTTQAINGVTLIKTWANAQIVKFTGESGASATDDVKQYGMTVDYWPAA